MFSISRAFFKLPADVKRNYKFDLVSGYLRCSDWHRTKQVDKVNSEIIVT